MPAELPLPRHIILPYLLRDNNVFEAIKQGPQKLHSNKGVLAYIIVQCNIHSSFFEFFFGLVNKAILFLDYEGCRVHIKKR